MNKAWSLDKAMKETQNEDEMEATYPYLLL